MDWHEGLQLYGENGSVIAKTFNPWYYKASEVEIFSREGCDLAAAARRGRAFLSPPARRICRHHPRRRADARRRYRRRRGLGPRHGGDRTVGSQRTAGPPRRCARGRSDAARHLRQDLCRDRRACLARSRAPRPDTTSRSSTWRCWAAPPCRRRSTRPTCEEIAAASRAVGRGDRRCLGHLQHDPSRSGRARRRPCPAGHDCCARRRSWARGWSRCAPAPATRPISGRIIRTMRALRPGATCIDRNGQGRRRSPKSAASTSASSRSWPTSCRRPRWRGS